MSENAKIRVINPTTGKTIAELETHSKKECKDIILKADKAFTFWRSVPAPKRGEIVRLIGEKIREKKDALGSLISLEMGKIKAEGDGEVQEMIDMADYAVGLSRMLGGKTMESERPQHRMYEQWHPLGVVGVITAFNFPMAVWAWNAFIAAICGNTVIWKPSSKTLLSALALETIYKEAEKELGYKDIFSIFMSHDKKALDAFAADKRVRLVSFTGSIPTGKHVQQIVARDLGKRCLLELGGNNCIIVDETANLNLAVPAIVFGAIGTAGQRCTTTRRVIVHKSRMEELETALVNAYSQIQIGNPLNKKVLMGPLIDRQALDNYMEAIREIKKIGGKDAILYGGKAIDGPGYFVEPTIVMASNDWDIVKRETFAPILYLIPYDDFDDAIRMQNNVPQGLSSALFTANIHNEEKFLSSRGSDCGIANINIGTSGAEIGGAFGGEKETGGGREAGSDSWKQYMRRQTTTINWGKDLPLAQGIKFEIKTKK